MSEKPYTPTTEEMRDYYAHGQFSDVTEREAVPAFNRWFAAEIAKAQADAWDEGFTACDDFVAGPDWAAFPPNPYRAPVSTPTETEKP